MEKPSNRKLASGAGAGQHHPHKGKLHTQASHNSNLKPTNPPATNIINVDELVIPVPVIPIQAEVEADDGFGTLNDSESLTNNQERPGEKPGRGGGRFIIKNLWDVCCNETELEIKELNTILTKLGLPSVNYTKSKTYEITDYDSPPELGTCKSKDFLDFYVFPYVLPAIQALIQFARVNRVFQCRFCTFNALDYIVEYLYNNNPRYPERLLNPTPIFDIPFAKAWLEKHPRKAPPKWMLMSSEEAAIIIQRAIRGYIVRCRPDVQEMRQFWRDYRKDLEDERALYGRNLPKNFSAVGGAFPDYEELGGEFESSGGSPHDDPSLQGFHSDQCIYCKAFRDFINNQPEIGTLTNPTDTLNSGGTSKPNPNNLGVNESSIARASVMESQAVGGDTDDNSQGKERHSKSSESGAPPETMLLVPPSPSKIHKTSASQKKSFSAAIHNQKVNALKHPKTGRKQDG